MGYAMGDHYQTSHLPGPTQPRDRKLADDAIFHSDRGSNYMSAEFGETLKQFGLRRPFRADRYLFRQCDGRIILRRPEERESFQGDLPDARDRQTGHHQVHQALV
ncbi:hypothetical protein ACFQ71_40675 [Streptomyces sp. NPDC056534]|uniref:hypothetical protein n=1 Tax=Streptomyces sp. NPDC056534 TaxID=3345857 RepID=UPI003682C00B